ncbi:TPA: hypothetical protein ACX6RX_003218 [Photobacterium damselae]
MTPNQLLASVKERFTPLLHNEEPKLNALLLKALMTYQDLAGITKFIRYNEPADKYDLPGDFLARVGVFDKNRDFVSSIPWSTSNIIELELTGYEAWPLTLSYMVNLAGVDFDTYQLPNSDVGLIGDYLEALIAIPNNERNRRVISAGKMDVSDLPVQSELNERVRSLEESMRLNRSIVMPFSFVG